MVGPGRDPRRLQEAAKAEQDPLSETTCKAAGKPTAHKPGERKLAGRSVPVMACLLETASAGRSTDPSSALLIRKSNITAGSFLGISDLRTQVTMNYRSASRELFLIPRKRMNLYSVIAFDQGKQQLS